MLIVIDDEDQLKKSSSSSSDGSEIEDDAGLAASLAAKLSLLRSHLVMRATATVSLADLVASGG